ncbi:sulfhydrogenase subunit gamma (sulfur reductase) [Desulfovibrionales bacterium]
MSLNNFSPYIPRPATIIKKEQLSGLVTFFEFELDNGQPIIHKPGQFIMLSIYGIGEAPFSISSAPLSDEGQSHFELAIRKIGTVTNAIFNLEPGQKVGIRGPYGSHFPIREFMGKDTILVAGGLGYIPLRSLLYYQLHHRCDFGRITVLVGTRNPHERIFVEQLDELHQRNDVKVMETVDVPNASWNGNVGVITALLPKIEISPAETYVAMVGPPIMYKFVIKACQDQGILSSNIYVSLERKMKCGVGKCGHCQINGINACIEGPVFLYNNIKTLHEAL